MDIRIEVVKEPTEAHTALLTTELRAKRDPQLSDENIGLHWNDATWLRVSLDNEVAGYMYYTKVTDILAELHGFAQTEKSATKAFFAVPRILEYIKDAAKIKKIFVTVPANAPQVWKFLFKLGFIAECKIKNGMVHDNKMVDLYYLTKDL